MFVAVTGHRPNKFFKYGVDAYEFHCPLRAWIRDQLKRWLLYLQPSAGISGMALGTDQDFAYVCCEVGLPFVAAVPCDGQDSQWPEESRHFYHELLSRAYQVANVTPGPYAVWKMQQRNEWMVDNCHKLLAVWDGSDGGTANCVMYAHRVHREVHSINPEWWRRS